MCAVSKPPVFELPLLLEAITGERGAQGTADAVIPSVDELIIVDLKYGRGVKVDAKDNEQLQLYALAALEAFDFAGPFQRVRLVIVQPRLGHLDEWVYSVAELHAFKQTVAPRAQRCMDAVKKYGNAGALPQEYFAPGEAVPVLSGQGDLSGAEGSRAIHRGGGVRRRHAAGGAAARIGPHAHPRQRHASTPAGCHSFN